MIEFYPQIRLLHITAISCSGALFAARGLAALAGMHWQRARWAQFLSYGINSILLVAATFLLAILPSVIFSNGWLHVKVLLVIAYLTLDLIAFWRERSRRTLFWLLIPAVLVYLQIYSIARAHHPLGMLYLWLS